MWVRLESNFFGHPKVEGLTAHAIELYFRALCRAGDQLTDGRVSASFVKGKRLQGLADRLVVAGLWHRSRGLDKACRRCWDALQGQPGDGFVIHDFLRYNPSKAEVEQRRAHDRFRKASRANPQGPSPGTPEGFQPEAERSPRVRPVRTNDQKTKSSVINPEGVARVAAMARQALKRVPSASPTEIHAEAVRYHGRPLSRSELA